jgi:hypothetical protein
MSVSQEKWDKAKVLIAKLWDVIEQAGVSGEGYNLSLVRLNYKELEVARCFLVHLSMTFEILTHHLKGFHLALASHLPQRDTNGWKLSDAEWSSYIVAKMEQGFLTEAELDLMSLKSNSTPYDAPPTTIPLIQHLSDDLYALREYLELDKPPEVQARRHNVQ